MQAKNINRPGRYDRQTWTLSGAPNTPTVEQVLDSNKDSLSNLVTSSGKRPKPFVPKAHSYVSVRWNKPKGTYHQIYEANGQLVDKIEGYLPAPSFQEPDPALSMFPNQSVLDNQALAKLNEKVRGSLDLSVSLFEVKQTRLMIQSLSPRGIANLVSPLRKWVKTVKAGNRPADFSPLTVPADVWLQWTYGLKPLVSDIYGVSEQMLRYEQNRLESFEASAVRVLDKRMPGGSYFQNNRVAWMEPVEGVRLTKYGIILDADLLNQNRVQFFTSLNPVSIAWELTPFSFVFDWFIDVGTYLRETETALLNNIAFKSGYKTQLLAYDAGLKVNGSFSQFGYRNTYNASGSLSVRRMNRTVLGSYPLPNLPRFHVNMGSSRLLSAAALMAQLLKP